MVKNKFFKKAAVAGLATVMTVAGSVMAFANNTTMYVGDDSVDCELTLPYEGARATMDSSSELEMKIDGQAYNPYGSYTLSHIHQVRMELVHIVTVKSVLTVHTQTAMHGTMTVITVQLRYMNRKNF